METIGRLSTFETQGLDRAVTRMLGAACDPKTQIRRLFRCSRLQEYLRRFLGQVLQQHVVTCHLWWPPSLLTQVHGFLQLL